ncbi:hypothetical protein Asi02nite_54180 [Asanoa siamensis]|uniref:Uncharacterized protein n=1 Tax=Asanoa siamensis TaxID=926357 RepID=A0ABQ4CX92_9ACTN|nr:hypothetical protein Asi02nite_54180 [Asanoa siamensis]
MPVRAGHPRLQQQHPGPGGQRRRQRVRQRGWTELRTFVEDGGTLLAIGDSVATARTLANLPITPALPGDEHEFWKDLRNVEARGWRFDTT